MVNYNYQSIGYAGTDITFTAPTGGVLQDAISATDAKGFFWVENAAAGGSITVTIHTPGVTFFGVNVPEVSISVPDGERRLIGPLVPDVGDPTALGAVLLSITGTMTGVTAAAVKVP